MKTTCLTAKLKLPFVEPFPDYHDINYKLEDLKHLFPQLRAKEVFFDGSYWGLFYAHGFMPEKPDVNAMLESAGALGDSSGRSCKSH